MKKLAHLANDVTGISRRVRSTTVGSFSNVDHSKSCIVSWCYYLHSMASQVQGHQVAALGQPSSIPTHQTYEHSFKVGRAIEVNLVIPQISTLFPSMARAGTLSPPRGRARQQAAESGTTYETEKNILLLPPRQPTCMVNLRSPRHFHGFLATV